MQLTNLLLLLFTTTSLSAPTTTRTSIRPTPTPSTAAKVATPRILKPATPPTKSDVQNSIQNWDVSVKTVNAYLNDPQNTTKLSSAILFAKDEPTQLATMMKVSNLSTSGKNAGTILMGNFPSIVSNLNAVMSGSMTTEAATMAVNFDRCCTVLPNIGVLWTEAGKSVGVANVSMPALESQCAMMSCGSGVSGGGGNGTAASM